VFFYAMSAHSLFISDLHLCASRPQVTLLFLKFLLQHAPQADALYILGDLFEYWAGDDDLNAPLHSAIATVLTQLHIQDGTQIFILHGNRDFLLGEAFATACHATLLADPCLINLYGTPTLLTHGDALCTDDVAYQTFRQEVRHPAWQQAFLAQPLTQRKAQIEQLRAQSEGEKQRKTLSIMDTHEAAIAELLRAHQYPPRLIHGHTHRQATHPHKTDGKPCQRWVLGDWHDTGNALHCDAAGCRWLTIGA
jgi:UDP-2,3-diacylglucosamine hydrolase